MPVIRHRSVKMSAVVIAVLCDYNNFAMDV